MHKEGRGLEYPLIDFSKFVCACLVILIHCVEVQDGHPWALMIVKSFCQQAVPFFFIVSGFFFGERLYTKRDKKVYVIKYAQRIFSIYIVWMILWFPSVIYTYHTIYSGSSTLYIILVIIRRIFFAGEGVYWYLLVLAEASLVIGFLVIKKKENILYVAGILGLILGLLFDANVNLSLISTINRFVYVLFSWSNNVIMKGIPYMALGVFLSQNRNYNLKKAPLIMSYLLASVVNMIIYAVAITFDTNLFGFICLYPVQAVMLFMLCIRSNHAKFVIHSGAVRDLSSFIYFTHTIFIYGIIDVIWPIDTSIVLRYAMTFMLCLISYIIVRKSKWSPVYWLTNMKLSQI